MPTSRWTEDEDTDLSFPLNSRSIIRIERPARLEPKCASDQQLDIKRRGVRMLVQPRNLGPVAIVSRRPCSLTIAEVKR